MSWSDFLEGVSETADTSLDVYTTARAIFNPSEGTIEPVSNESDANSNPYVGNLTPAPSGQPAAAPSSFTLNLPEWSQMTILGLAALVGVLVLGKVFKLWK